MSLIKSKFPSKSCQVQCWCCERTILKLNFKTQTQTVHPGKPVREKLKGAAFDLFEMASKRNGDEVSDLTSKKAREQSTLLK